MKTIRVKKTSSGGYAVAPAFKYEFQYLRPDDYNLSSQDEVKYEIERFRNAVSLVANNLEKKAKDSDIFGSHLMIALDQSLHESVQAKITEQLINAEQALQLAADEIRMKFESMDDAYLRERAVDMTDVGRQLLSALQNKQNNILASINQPVIVVATELAPSDIFSFDHNLVRGVISEKGSLTSHVSILARTLGLPALVGIDRIMDEVETGDLIVMDAQLGEIVIHPDNATMTEYIKKAAAYQARQADFVSKAPEAVMTIDGKSVNVYANVSIKEDLMRIDPDQIDGIGLFRTEYMYMGKHKSPTEEEQFEVYKFAASTIKKEITIRTLDIGDEKASSLCRFDPEENSCFDWRTNRFLSNHANILKVQLKAILRASAFGHFRIMIPMVVFIEEIEQTKCLLEACKQELKDQSIIFDEDIKLGIMIETPAAVLCADDFAKIVDFFSIGTNDLAQYLLAADRNNGLSDHLYDAFHPAVLRSIKHVIDAGHNAGIRVGMCGEFASDSLATAILIGMGLDEFSMSFSEVTKIKERISQISCEQAVNLAETSIRYSRVSDIKDHIDQFDF